MGNSSSQPPTLHRPMLQHEPYTLFAQRFGREFSSNLLLPSCVSTDGKTTVTPGPFALGPVKPTFLISVCAYQGRDDIDHILDGYSTAMLLSVVNAPGGGLKLQFVQKPLEDEMFQRELVTKPPRPNSDACCCWCCVPVYGPEDETVPIESVEMRNQSCCDRPLYTGLLNGKITWYNLLCTNALVERTTGHQPIYVQGFIYSCSAINWQPFAVEMQDDLLKMKRVVHTRDTSPLCRELAEYPTQREQFFCMHPHEDINHVDENGNPDPRCLTYSFEQAKCSQTTTVTFYEFGLEKPLEVNTSRRKPQVTTIVIPCYSQLHMFGFTQNFYLLFVSVLAVDKCHVCCTDDPLLRASNEDFSGDLLIYLVRRPDAPVWLPKLANIDTRVKGDIFHTVNCFEETHMTDDHLDFLYQSHFGEPQAACSSPAKLKYRLGCFPTKIVLDGWTTAHSALRMSSQFELTLRSDRSVWDDQGHMMRYTLYLDPTTFFVQSLYVKVVYPEVDSSIDFHCINPFCYGKPYHYFWLVAHHRVRPCESQNIEGHVSHVYSNIYSFTMPYTAGRTRSNADSGDPRASPSEPLQWSTNDHLPTLTPDNELVSYYLRTPLFVARETITDSAQPIAHRERDGFLFVWAYRLVHADKYSQAVNMSAHIRSTAPLQTCVLLLIFDAAHFDAQSQPWIIEFAPDVVIPYSVHSWSHQLQQTTIDKLYGGATGPNAVHVEPM
eukprot:gnl/Spiro4/3737_TR1831_c0_g1_i2.p1 gnl/Spiro4/3737_TR1831_c0_g1~~gnl/Spiro4/3737_TR1831_c0_g1_i2.p1  ORF type:complete len:734 (+),score=250.01 gnl/Spiro4/3737_TR1831_c0_g1_i2:43-2202(+)